MLPTLTVNRQFIEELMSARTPCFALGMVELEKRWCGLLALRPDKVIPAEIADAGFRFGHSLLGDANFEVVHFAFHFYGFETYNALVNPSSPLVQAVLTTMVQRGDYFFFAVTRRGTELLSGQKLGKRTFPELGPIFCESKIQGQPISSIVRQYHFSRRPRNRQAGFSIGFVERMLNTWISLKVALN